jgi:hypothetical protein
VALTSELINLRTFNLYFTTNRTGTFFLWPLQLPDSDGTWNAWHQSRERIILMAREKWTAVKTGQEGYESRTPENSEAFGEPLWPELTPGQVNRIAFGDRYINSFDHPVLKRIRGAV